MIAPARVAALAVLQAVEGGSADLPSALAGARARLTDARDQSLLAELATGTLRWRGQLDHLIGHASTRPLDRLDPDVLGILRLGAYQLLHLDRVPAAAVVDDAVQMVRKARKSSAAGFVNAVLRTISRSRGALPLPPRPALLPDGSPASHGAALEYLSITLSHPRWLVERWLERHGFAAVESWVQFNNRPAPLTLRANTLRVSRDDLGLALARAGFEVRPANLAPDGLIAAHAAVLGSAAAEDGLFVVQDEASQIAALLALPRPGERVLDACAAPGGKTLVMASALEGTGLLVAADLRARRVELLRQTLHRCRLSGVSVVRLDLMQPLPFADAFECVFVDAPCSGLGTIRRDPEIRWRRTPADLARFADAQRRMLEHAARAVRPGGRLAYATCSSEPAENEEVLAAFLGSRTDFTAMPGAELAGRLPGAVAPLIDEGGRLRTWPWRHDLEAFFGAVLVKSP